MIYGYAPFHHHVAGAEALHQFAELRSAVDHRQDESGQVAQLRTTDAKSYSVRR
jgi:hypothetical protein